MDAIEIRPHDGPQEQFLSSSADIVIYGGAAGGGKTWALLMEPLRHVDNAKFSAVIFRESHPQIHNEGGLWDESNNIYPLLSAEPFVGRSEWRFPSGATVRFAHLYHEADKYNWQGAQIPLICFDELTQLSDTQFFYLLSRNRSTCGVTPYIRATCNPDADSWVASFVEWWIDQETGFPVPERAGKVRWFVRDGGNIEWAGSRDGLVKQFPDQEPKSVSFVPAKLEDNPTLMQADPGYRSNLLALPTVERERLLAGNWKIQMTEGAWWEGNPEYFDKHIWTDEWPDRLTTSAVAIDPSGGRSDKSDFTAIVFIGVARQLLWVDAIVARLTSESLAPEAVTFCRERAARIVGLESSFGQDWLFPLLDRECEDRGLPPLPLARITNQTGETGAKEKLIKDIIGPLLQRGKFRFRRSSLGCQTLVSQLRNFGVKGAHDDGPDALQMAIRLLQRLPSMQQRAATPEEILTV